MPLAIVIAGTEQLLVRAIVRDDLPLGWSPPDGCEVVPVSQLPAGWRMYAAKSDPVPEFVFPWQLQTWLLQNKGITPLDVEGLIGLLPAQARTQAIIDWTKAATYKRDHPLIDQVGASLGMTPEDIDQAFREASQLQG